MRMPLPPYRGHIVVDGVRNHDTILLVHGSAQALSSQQPHSAANSQQPAASSNAHAKGFGAGAARENTCTVPASLVQHIAVASIVNASLHQHTSEHSGATAITHEKIAAAEMPLRSS